MFNFQINIELIIYSAFVMWALLSVLFDFYEIVKKIVKNPAVRTRLMCPKCLSFWLVLLFTGHFLTALIVAFIINLYSKYIKFVS